MLQVWNPILYALLNLQLRAAFLQLVPQCLKQGMVGLCGQKKGTGPNGHQRQNSAEESRLLGTVAQRLDAVGRPRQGSEEAGAKKWLNCFLNSSGSVESSTSEPRPQLLIREEQQQQKRPTTALVCVQ